MIAQDRDDQRIEEEGVEADPQAVPAAEIGVEADRARARPSWLGEDLVLRPERGREHPEQRIEHQDRCADQQHVRGRSSGCACRTRMARLRPLTHVEPVHLSRHSAPSTCDVRNEKPVNSATMIKQDPGQRRGIAHAEELERLLVEVEGVEQRRVDRIAGAARDDEGGREALEALDGLDDGVEEHHRGQHRQRDLPEQPATCRRPRGSRPRTCPAGSGAARRGK